jgi:hypothetical protein
MAGSLRVFLLREDEKMAEKRDVESLVTNAMCQTKAVAAALNSMLESQNLCSGGVTWDAIEGVRQQVDHVGLLLDEVVSCFPLGFTAS